MHWGLYVSLLKWEMGTNEYSEPNTKISTVFDLAMQLCLTELQVLYVFCMIWGNVATFTIKNKQ